MATNHIAGDLQVWDHVAGSDINSGDVVVMDDVRGVALTDIATGATGAVAVSGTFRLPKGATAFAQGATVDWSGSQVIAGAGNKLGVVRDAAASGDATVNVQLER